MKCEPSSVGVAVICTLAASEPASCSVSANAPSCSPVTSFGSHFWFCSGVPKSSNARIPMEWCAFTKTDVDAHRRPISSRSLQLAICVRPSPPYSTGAVAPSTPTRPRPSMTLRGMSACRSISAGSRSSSRNCRSSASDLSNSVCCAAGMRGYGITQSATKCPWKRPLAKPTACGPAKSSSSACWISFCRCASSLFIKSVFRKERATHCSRAHARVQSVPE